MQQHKLLVSCSKMVMKQLQRFKASFWSANDDFFADRLCYRYGLLILVASAVVISLATNHENDNQPMVTCWCPAHFTASHVNYANQICSQKFLTDHTVSPNDSEVQSSKKQSNSLNGIKQTSNYLPLVLALLGLLAIVPRLMWKNLTGHFAETTVKALSTQSRHEEGTQRQHLRPIAAHVLQKTSKSLPLVSITYIMTKCMYCLVIVMQFVVLHYLMNWSDVNFKVLFSGETPDLMDPFNCSFNIRQLGRELHYVVQCIGSADNKPSPVETSTMAFLHLWLIGCLATMSFSTLLWVVRLCSSKATSSAAKVKHVSILLGSPTPRDGNALVDFTDKHLCADGFLILKLVEENVSLTAASELVSTMWEMYEEEKQCSEKDKIHV